MTRTTRRIIFYLATIIFLAAGYVVLLYAQGYRYSFADARFTRTGAVSLRVNTQAEVFVNGVMKDTTSFITNSSSIGGLLPGPYTVSVQKDNYSRWQKKVTVQEGFVQDFPHVLLLPLSGTDYDNVVTEVQNLLHPPTLPILSPTPSATQNRESSIPSSNSKNLKGIGTTPRPSPSPSPTPNVSAPFYIDRGTLYVQSTDGDGPVSIASSVTKVYQSDDSQKLIWAIGNQVWIYWLYDQNEQPFHKQGDIAVIGKFSAPVKATAWFRDSAHIAVDAGAYKILELDTRGGQNIITL